MVCHLGRSGQREWDGDRIKIGWVFLAGPSPGDFTDDERQGRRNAHQRSQRCGAIRCSGQRIPVEKHVQVGKLRLYDLLDKQTSYQTAWQLQKELVADRRQDKTLLDAVILVEHPPVYTLGTGSSIEHLRFPVNSPPPGATLERIDRGGEVTYHGPGQLVVYPIINLRRAGLADLHKYLYTLEECVIQALNNLPWGQRRPVPRFERKSGMTGVWVNDAKVCAVGIKVSSGWISSHGLALNITTDLSSFGHIVPCGIHDYPVTRLVDLGGARSEFPMKSVAALIVDKLARLLSDPADIVEAKTSSGSKYRGRQ